MLVDFARILPPFASHVRGSNSEDGGREIVENASGTEQPFGQSIERHGDIQAATCGNDPTDCFDGKVLGLGFWHRKRDQKRDPQQRRRADDEVDQSNKSVKQAGDEHGMSLEVQPHRRVAAEEERRELSSKANTTVIRERATFASPQVKTPELARFGRNSAKCGTAARGTCGQPSHFR